jgi:hypothetical protein
MFNLRPARQASLQAIAGDYNRAIKKRRVLSLRRRRLEETCMLPVLYVLKAAVNDIATFHN